MKKSKTVGMFNRTMKRCNNLMIMHALIRKHKSDYPTPSDMVRSAVVLSVSAMDSYFTNRYAEVLIPYIKKHGATKDIIGLLSDAGLDTQTALEIIAMERHYRGIRTLVDKHLANYTTQKMHVIDSLFIGFGISDFSENVQRKKGRKNLVRSVEILVERRHKIVHAGDYDSHHKLRKINPDQIQKRLRDLSLFIQGAEELIQKRIK